MKPTKGYYSIIQYCPDRSRGEAANIGVLLFCPETGFLKAQTAKGNQRIRKFFGSEGHDWKRINSYKRALRERLRTRPEDFRTIDDLEEFIALRANEISLTPPRSMRVQNPEEVLEFLFAEVVGTPLDRPSSTNFKNDLREKLATPCIAEKVVHDIHVKVPVFQKEVEFPFGYQNGHFNLINPVKFEAADQQSSLRSACTYAVEGQSIASQKHPLWGEMRLVIVGQFRPRDAETPERIRRVFDEYDVSLFTSEEIPSLIDEIDRTGKILKPSAFGS